MDSTALRDLFRIETKDLETPPLWSDTEIFSYIDDAQKMFCRLQGGIADSSSTLTQVALTANQPFADISPLILKIRQVTRASDYKEVEILNFEDLQAKQAPEDYGIQQRFRLDGLIGEVRAVVVGMETNKLRLVRIPAMSQTLNLITYRLPLVDITTTGQSLEIDSIHHRHLLDWMKHLAHKKQDAETYDRGRSEEFGAAFRAYCDQAKAEREKREHKYRTIGYGGL